MPTILLTRYSALKLIKQKSVTSSISDADANLSVLGVFQLVQDAVTEMLGNANLDGPTLRKEYNAIWLFTRNRTKLFKSVPWGVNAITVTAFVSSIARATLCVDTCIKDTDGEICAYSRIEMCALDLSTMRIRRIDTVGITADVQAEQPEMDVAFTTFDLSPTTQIDSMRIGSTNIDISQHTNNVEYIRFILNTYTVKQLRDNPIREMEIRYINQSYENDVLTVFKQNGGNHKDMFLIKCADKDTVKCEVLF